MARAQLADDIYKTIEQLEEKIKRLENAFLNKQAIGAFEARPSGTFGPSGAGWIVVTMAAEQFDVSSWYDTATSKYTPLRAGYYLLHTHIHESTVGTGHRLIAGISKNGTLYAGVGQYTTVAGDDYRVDVTRIIFANGTTDWFQPAYNHNSGTSQSVGVECAFSGHYIGAA